MGPLGDLSETRGEACDASQILSAWSRKYKSALHPMAPPPRKRAKSPLNDEVAAVLHDAGLRQYYEPFVENEIDVLARVEINQCVRLS